VLVKGSSKYPEENSFKNWTEQKGYWSYETISPHLTAFHGNFEHKDLEEFLDRLTDCFKSPLL